MFLDGFLPFVSHITWSNVTFYLIFLGLFASLIFAHHQKGKHIMNISKIEDHGGFPFDLAIQVFRWDIGQRIWVQVWCYSGNGLGEHMRT
jgi:hypothetical protein